MFSDLIDEVFAEFSKFKPGALITTKHGRYGLKAETYEISTQSEKRAFHKDIGKYTLLYLKDLLEDEDHFEYYLDEFVRALRPYLSDVHTNDVVLVVGLGNRHISADSLGINVIKNLIITRSMVKSMPKVCAFSPSVMGLTGIETADTVDAITRKIKPNYVVFVDSLCASHSERLGRSFQISNTAVTPGEGVDNTRKKFVTKGVKVVSIGVPFVVYSDTFIKSAFNDINIDIKSIKNPELKGKLNKLFTSDNPQLVTLKDIEEIVEKAGKLIAMALNRIIIGIDKL